MAAQEYYQGTSGAPPPVPSPAPAASSARPTPSIQVPGNPPYPLYDGPPPPYSPGEQRANSQPPPHRRTDSLGDAFSEKPQYSSRPPTSGQPSPRLSSHPPQDYGPSARPPPAEYDNRFRPAVKQQHSYAYPDEKRGQQAAYPQQGYSQRGYPQQYGPSAPPVQPYHQNGVAFAPSQNQYYPPRERSRSRSRSRDRKKHHQRKKSSGINTFLGAGGGAIIGDAIFPGLGTLGGALLGGFGGHEYGKQKSKDTRHRERRYSDEYEYRPSRRN